MTVSLEVSATAHTTSAVQRSQGPGVSHFLLSPPLKTGPLNVASKVWGVF